MDSTIEKLSALTFFES
ncbi:putative chitin-binding peritrophin-A domain protein, partial [Danaus plexippus plexippus]